MEVIWWLWTAFPEENIDFVHVFHVDPESDDLYWLGEGGWVYRTDNTGLGLVTV